MKKTNLIFFTVERNKEYGWRWFYLALMVILTAVLLLFWEPLRSQEFMTALAQWRPAWLYTFFNAFTMLGDDIGIMFITLIIYWSIDKKLGFNAMMVLLAAAIYMHILKGFFYEPRPLEGQQKYDCLSFPSGHTLTTYVVWMYIAHHAQKKVLWAVAATVVILMGISRIVLGVHFPGDIIGGYIFGTVFLVAVILIAYLAKKRGGNDNASTTALKVVLLSIFFAVVSARVLYLYPSEDATMVVGFLAGLLIGATLENALVRFKVTGSPFKKVLRIIVGVAVLFYLAKGLEASFLLEPHWNLLRFLVAGLWTTFFAPLIFLVVRLADRE